MANSPGSKKRARQAVKRHERTAALRSMVRTYIKKVKYKTDEGNYDAAQEALVAAIPCIDSMVNKGILKKQTAARTKSRLNAQVKALKTA